MFRDFFNTNITKDKRCVVDQHGNKKNRPVVYSKLFSSLFFIQQGHFSNFVSRRQDVFDRCLLHFKVRRDFA